MTIKYTQWDYYIIPANNHTRCLLTYTPIFSFRISTNRNAKESIHIYVNTHHILTTCANIMRWEKWGAISKELVSRSDIGGKGNSLPTLLKVGSKFRLAACHTTLICVSILPYNVCWRIDLWCYWMLRLWIDSERSVWRLSSKERPSSSFKCCLLLVP